MNSNNTQNNKTEEWKKTLCEEWALNIKKILFTEEEIQKRIDEMAKIISEDYKGKNILAIVLLKGAMMFSTDLLKRLKAKYEVDNMVISSYGNETVSPGSIRIKKDLSIDPKDRHVLIIEDLIDTGNTLNWIIKHLQLKGCASIKIAVLLNKKCKRIVNIPIDYVGFECPDEFVIGYGMDYMEKYRCLPFIGILNS